MSKGRKDFTSAAANTILRLITGPLSLILIPLYLTKETQGFWYTFISLSALSVFADLGFSTIILQFAAHEFSYLKFGPYRVIQGDVFHKHKLASLMRFALKYGLILTIIVFPLIFSTGWFLFASKTTSSFWLLPWLIYLAGSSLSFVNSVVLCLIEGCDSVAEIHAIRGATALTTTAVTLTLLMLNCSLYSLALGMTVGQLVSAMILVIRYRHFLRDLFEEGRRNPYLWRPEIFSLLKRYAVSWSFGYLIFQIYTPLTFRFHGPIEAGKVGITLTLWNSIFSISLLFITIITPRMNMLISSGSWPELEQIFRRNFKYTLLTFMLGGFIVIGLVLTGYPEKIMARFLGISAMVSLFIMWFNQLVVSAWAVYIRGHKIEPLLIPTVCIAIISAAATYLLAKYAISDYLFFGYALCSMFYLPILVFIVRRVRKSFHYRPESEFGDLNKVLV